LYFSFPFAEELPIFGVPLSMAVQRNPCHDGLKIPLVIRNCIDYVQEHGMNMKGVAGHATRGHLNITVDTE
jgi:hypothetical protein